MNLSLKERRIVLNWFDIAVECDTLGDVDLKLYDKIRESVDDDDDDIFDPLAYNPSSKKKSNSNNDDDNFDDVEEDFGYDMDEYTDEDKY